MACSFKAAETGEIQSRLFRFLQIAKLKPEKGGRGKQLIRICTHYTYIILLTNRLTSIPMGKYAGILDECVFTT